MKTPEVRDSFICYFDILGYKEYIKYNGENQYLMIIELIINNIISSIQSINYELDTFFSVLYDKRKFIQYRIFSDNIIMAVDTVGDDYINVRVLQKIISHMAELQALIFLNYGVSIRGAVIRGTVYFDKNYVFGEGLIKAYYYENDIAIFPRIIIDKECENLLNSEMRLKRKLVEYMDVWIDITNDYYEFTILDFDGYIFINYLFSEKENIIERNLVNHKKCIEDSMRHTNNQKVYQKFSWCKTYHNIACDRYKMTVYKIN